MLNQKNPNAWSCLPTAFANVLDLELDRVLFYLGHDGSEIVRAGLPDPLCRKGFHPHELIRLCLEMQRAVTRYELIGQATPGNTFDPTVFDFGGWPPFITQMYNSLGVLDVRTSMGVGHAMSYRGNGDHAEICDPANGEVFEFSDPADTEKHGRFITALWRIDRINI
jgi:hypothetical protein